MKNKKLINSIDNIKAFFDTRSYSNLSVKAYDMLQEMIVTLILKPGDTYSEGEISNMLKIGRTPVREAIKKLETEMILIVSPRSGVKIADISLEDCLLQIEVRRSLEKLVIARASKLALPFEREHLNNLAGMHDKATDAHDGIGTVRVDTEFHNAIADYARNPFAKRALIPFQLMERRLYYVQYNIEPGLIEDLDKKQSEMIREIAQGDGAKACEIFDYILERLENLVRLRLNFSLNISSY